MIRRSSPRSVSAPAPAAVSVLASAVVGFRVSFVRRSPRSFSGWVCVCCFSSTAVAGGFAEAVASGLSLPFCRVRRCFGGWGVSVPVFCRWLRVRRRSVFRVLPVRCALAASLPAFVRSALVCACAVGFSGSRSSVPAACALAAAAVAPPFGPPVFVGCAGALTRLSGPCCRGLRCCGLRLLALVGGRLRPGRLLLCRLLCRLPVLAVCGCRFRLVLALLGCSRPPRRLAAFAVLGLAVGPRWLLLPVLGCLAWCLGFRPRLLGVLLRLGAVGSFGVLRCSFLSSSC
jgi:hypothetical protein